MEIQKIPFLWSLQKSSEIHVFIFSEAIFWLTFDSCSTGSFFPRATDVSGNLPCCGLSTVCSFLQGTSPLLAWGPSLIGCSVGICSCLFFCGLLGKKPASHGFCYREISLVPGELPSPLTGVHRAAFCFFSPYLSQMLPAFFTLSSTHYSRERISLTDGSWFFWARSKSVLEPARTGSIQHGGSPWCLLRVHSCRWGLPKPCHANKTSIRKKIIQA